MWKTTEERTEEEQMEKLLSNVNEVSKVAGEKKLKKPEMLTSSVASYT